MQFKNLFFKRTSFLVLWVSAFCMPTLGVAQVSGSVFRDFNANGTREVVQASPFVGESGVSGVTVTAYSQAGASVTTTTSADGSFTLATTAGTWRVELSNIPSYLKPGAAGRTTVEFVSNGTNNLMFGLNNPADYSQSNPYLAVPDHAFGSHTDPANANLSALEFVNHTWGNTTKGASPEWDVTPWQQPSQPGSLGSIPQLGTLYGVAWNRTNNYIYAAAYHKNFTDYGPGGPGMIYRIPINPQTGAATGAPQQWVNVANFAGNSMPCYHASDLTAGVDNTVLDYVGKCGLGDLDISEDDQYLYVVNLTNRKLLQIRTSDGGLNNSWNIPTNQGSCTGNPNDIRPFGLGIKDGLVYVGSVCSRETQAANYFPPDPPSNNGQIYVNTFNPQTNSWLEVLNSYIGRDEWNPWVSNHTALLHDWRTYQGSNPWSYVQIPQPMLTDIEFYGNDMILGIRDRCGDIWGSKIPDPLGGGTLISCIGTGDVLTAAPNGSGGYTLESNQVCGNRTASPLSSDITFLPSGQHQFYWADGWNQTNATVHFEQSFGGLAQFLLEPVAMTSLTPTNAFDAAQTEKGGVLWMNNLTGGATRAYVLYHDNAQPGVSPGRMAKANGLGDIEALSFPAPLEIGNRVWNDTDADGIQDAGELGISGVTINLYQGNTQVATTTTASDGTYYFNASNVTMNGATGLLPNTPYEIRIPNASGASKQAALGARNLTTANAGSNDNIDSDATLSGVNAIIALTTGNAGENNHSYDIGFGTIGSVGNYVWCDTDADGIQDLGELGINGVTVELYKETSPGSGSYALAQTTTTANDGTNDGAYNFVITQSANYYVHFPTSTGGKILTTQTTTAATNGNSDANTTTGNSPVFAIDVNGTGVAKDNPTIDAGFKCNLTAAITKSNDLSCPTPTATLTASPATGVSYLWDNGSTSATRVVSAAGTYSVTVTDPTSGCSASANVTVTSAISVPPCVTVTIQKTN